MDPAPLHNVPHPFEQHVQQTLQSDVADVTVCCSWKQGKWFILADHPAIQPAESEALLKALVEVVKQAPREVLSVSVQAEPVAPTAIQIYLRVKGEPHPYRSHLLRLEEPDGNDLDGQAPFPGAEFTPDQPGLIHTAPVESDPSADLDRLDKQLDEDMKASSRALLESDSLPPGSGKQKQPEFLPVPLIAVGTGLAIASFFGVLLYILSRPCAVGACVPLQQAQQLSQKAMYTIDSTTSAMAIVDAYDDLLDASYLLGTIPRWSGHYRGAQTLLSQLQVETDALEHIVKALHQANLASQRSQNPPHPLPEWRAVQALWEEAIASLKRVPPDSPIHPLAQRKLEEYQANLASIKQRLRLEYQAQDKVTTARTTAQMAETRQDIAQSVEEWRLAFATWQTVVELLKQVPQTTMAYAEAQQLLDLYQRKLASVRDRHTKEEISAKAYQQALQFADRAQASETRNQWSEAVVQWREALTYAEQVPEGTTYYPQVEPLVATYQRSLDTAQSNLRVAVALHNAQDRFESVCQTTGLICNYTIASGAIQLELMPEYDDAVEQAIFIPAPTTGYWMAPEVATQVSALLQTISTVGQTSRVPIHLHKADGNLFGIYDPELAGYVRR